MKLGDKILVGEQPPKIGAYKFEGKQLKRGWAEKGFQSYPRSSILCGGLIMDLLYLNPKKTRAIRIIVKNEEVIYMDQYKYFNIGEN